MSRGANGNCSTQHFMGPKQKCLTNALSKKVENHAYAVALHMMYYNFVRIHQSLRITPAMAVGVTDTLWSLEDIVRVVGEWEASK